MNKLLCFLTILGLLFTVVSIKGFAAAEEINISSISDKYLEDSVTISGNTTFNEVSIKVLYPNGDQYNIETVQSIGSTYSYTFTLASDLPYGSYTVIAGRGDKVVVAEFKVKQKNNHMDNDPEDDASDEPRQENENTIIKEPEKTSLDDSSINANEEDMNNKIKINEIIAKIRELTDTSGIISKGKRDMERNLIKTLESIVTKELIQRVKVDIVDSKATIKINEGMVDSMINIMGEIVNLIEELNKKFKDNSIEKKIEKKLTLSVDTDNEVTSVKAEIPVSIFSAAEEKDIDEIEIKSSIASFEIPPDFLKESKLGSTCLIEANRIELSNEEKSKFSENQRQLLEGQGVLYDFNIVADGQQISKFSNKITIRLKYIFKEGEDKDNITILHLADDGTIKNMVGRYDAETGEVIFTTDHFSKFIIKSIIIPFTDIKETFWARKYIESMASKGVINGKPDGSYDPYGMVTRAEFAKMITVAKGIVDDEAKCTFNDVSESQWYYTYVSSAVNAGIITGKPNNIFAPDDNITRQEMAVMAYRALGEAPPKDVDLLLGYNDSEQIADWAMDAVTTIVKTEIMNGKPGNIMDPNGYSTRAEAMSVIYRFFNY